MDTRLQIYLPSGRQGKFFAVRSAWGCSCFLLALAINLDGRLLAWVGANQMIRNLGLFCLVLGAIMVLLEGRGFKRFWGE